MKNSSRLSWFLGLLMFLSTILTSCGQRQLGFSLEGSSPSCKNKIITDTQIKFEVPNTGPVSVGFNGSGIVIESNLLNFEIEQYIGPPPSFEGFDCLTVIIRNRDYDGDQEQIVVFFEDGHELRLGIYSESITEYIFSSGRMAASPGKSSPHYIEYNYLTSTLSIDARVHRIEYLEIVAEEVPENEEMWFCSRHLEESSRDFIKDISIIFSSWFRDITNHTRKNLLSFGFIAGTLIFWTSLLILLGITFWIGWIYRRKGLLLFIFWVIVPISIVTIFAQILFYEVNCPIV